MREINGGVPLEYYEALGDAINARNAAAGTPEYEQCVWLVNSLYLAIQNY